MREIYQLAEDQLTSHVRPLLHGVCY